MILKRAVNVLINKRIPLSVKKKKKRLRLFATTFFVFSFNNILFLVMVQLSIVIPTNNFTSSSKRKVDEHVKNIKVEENEEEQPKKPRLEDNEAGRRRNKRLFGVLLGTLNKFKDDTEQTSEVDKKRREINQKLQDKLDLEKKALVEKMEARKLEKERLEQMKREEEEKIVAEKKVKVKK
ncbi:unnamed protein product [Rhizopus stolonifer]